MVTSRSAAGCLLGRERRAGNRPAVHAACNYRVFSWKLNCNKSLLSAPPNTPSADWTPARGGHKGTAARKNPDQIFATSVCAATTWPKNRTNEALQQVNKGSASNGPKPGCPWLISLFFCTSVKRNAAWFFFFQTTTNFLYSTFSSVWSKQRTTMAKQDWFSCWPFPQSDKVTGSNASLGAFLRIGVGF